jgi:hypothetical protein
MSISSEAPKSIGLCAASYGAEQVPGLVLVYAHGFHMTSGYKVFFERSPIDVYPPEFVLWHIKPSGVVLEVITPFTEMTEFRADKKVAKVVVHDSNGRHEVPVEQVPDTALRHS